MLTRLFHVNICVRDMERSIGFYEKLGFRSSLINSSGAR